MTSNSPVPNPKLKKPRIQSIRRIASALTLLTVPTYNTRQVHANAVLLILAHIDSLRIVPQPIAKIDPLDVELRELLSPLSAGHEKSKQGIFEVSMTPILALNLGEGGNVAGAESVGWVGIADE